jgi:hypothetical protein
MLAFLQGKPIPTLRITLPPPRFLPPGTSRKID